MKARWAQGLALALLALTLSGCASTLQDRIGNPLPAALRDSPDRFIVVTVENHTKALSARAGSTPRAYGGLQNYVATTAARAQVAAIARDYHLSEVAAWPIPVLRVHCVVFEIPESSTQAGVLAQLAHEPRVKIAQPLGTFQTMSGPSPPIAYNDPYVSLQKGFEKIDVADAHRWSRGDGVRVAIVDTGIDVGHPELKNRVVVARNFVDTDATQFRRDRHGTEVAGVIASLANNKLGIVGVAPGVKLIALKACWQLEAGADGARCNSFTLAKALVAAMDEGAQVVNLSLAGPTDPLLASLVESGVQKGIVFVGAVAPPPQQELSGFPGGAAGMLAVDSSEDHAAKNGVLMAPGNEILTLTPEGHFDFASGSSLATAHVTGTVALLLAQNPKLKPEALQGLLSRTSTRSADHSDRTIESINACAAVASLSQSASCDAAPRVADQDTPAAVSTAGSMR